MSKQRIDQLTKKISELKAQPLDKRDHEALKAAVSELNAIYKQPMSKEEFKKVLYPEGYKEPEQVIEINNMDELDQAWDKIISMKVMVNAPEDIQKEIRRRFKKHYGKINVKGFRPRKL